MAAHGRKRKKPETETSPANTGVKRPARGYHTFRNGMLNVTPKGVEVEITNANSKTSPLLRLPREIRDVIWKEALGTTTFEAKYRNRFSRRGPHWEASPKINMSLLRVCRQIYAEASLVPYQFNTFAAASQDVLMPQLRKMKPYYRQYIQELQLPIFDVMDNSLLPKMALLLPKLTVVKLKFSGHWNGMREEEYVRYIMDRGLTPIHAGEDDMYKLELLGSFVNYGPDLVRLVQRRFNLFKSNWPDVQISCVFGGNIKSSWSSTSFER